MLGITKMETLKKIPNHSLYSVTKDGRIYTYRYRKGWITGATDKLGYKRLNAVDDTGKRSNLYVHRAVAMTYLPNPKGKPHVNHKDNNPSNNHISNLEWCTAKENRAHAAKQNRLPRLQGDTNGNHKYSRELVKKIRSLYESGRYSQSEISRKYGVPTPTIHVIVKRKQWSNI